MAFTRRLWALALPLISDRQLVVLSTGSTDVDWWDLVV